MWAPGYHLTCGFRANFIITDQIPSALRQRRRSFALCMDTGQYLGVECNQSSPDIRDLGLILKVSRYVKVDAFKI